LSSHGESALQPLLDLSAAIGCGEQETIVTALEGARVGATPARVDEAILQAYLFVGFPAVLGVLGRWRELSPASPAVTETEPATLEVYRERGEALCRTIYGDAYDSLRANIRGLHPTLDRWMIEEGYGKTLSRPVLTPIERELCIVALLAAGGWEPQLRSHLLGALNVGATPAAVEGALRAGLSLVSDPGSRRQAEALWDRMCTRPNR